jgi:hypothetical protein
MTSYVFCNWQTTLAPLAGPSIGALHWAGRAPNTPSAATGVSELERHKRYKRSVINEALNSFFVNEVVD